MAHSFLFNVKFLIQVVNRSESPPDFVFLDFLDGWVIDFKLVFFGMVELAVMHVEA